jgi:formate dehydrogenase subunit gamma
MTTLRHLIVTLLLTLLAAPMAQAQAVVPPPDEPVAIENRQTLADILARQRGEGGEREPRLEDSAADNAAGLGTQLGPLGADSDSEVWEAIRFGTDDVTVSAGGAPARVLIQDGGMWWQQFRQGPLREYGGYLLLGTIAVLALFYLLRGRIRVSSGMAGVMIPRFHWLDRFSHWLLAGSFLLLAFTGLITLFGRNGLIPFLGKDAYAVLAQYSKWIHNNVSWAFMLALVMVFVLWIANNLPTKADLNWLIKGGGIFSKGHPPSWKFNAGQKLIFWSVILLGASISLSGLSLLFPYELPLFAKTFGWLNGIGLPGWLEMQPFPERMSPQEEMQFAQLWHAIVGFVLMAIIIAHIYIGTIGMEGAFSAMKSGEVDLNWAKEHHSLWVEQKQAEKHDRAPATPAE